MKKLPLFIALWSAVLMLGCQTRPESSEPGGLIPDKANFSQEVNGKPVGLYILKGSDRFSVAVTNYGARVVGVYLPDKNGEITNVALGFDSVQNYVDSPDAYFGPVVGRVANRIAGGTFRIGGKEYHVPINNGPNSLHGGINGLDRVVWDVVSSDDKKVVLHYLSPDMEEGYPGNLDITVSYAVNDSALTIAYRAVTDKATPVNLTSHVYYNLNGKSNIPVTNHILTLNADKYTPVDSTLIPTGSIDPVDGTPLDFTQPKPIGQDIGADNEQLKFAGGYDHNFIINGTGKEGGMELAAVIRSPLTGIGLKVYTEEPGIQFYSGNFFKGNVVTSDGHAVGFRCGFALEPQHYPDAVNRENFPSILLQPGETYSTQSMYVFRVGG